MTLEERIRAALDTAEVFDKDAIARDVWQQLHDAGEQEQLYPLLASKVAQMRRLYDSALEQAAFDTRMRRQLPVRSIPQTDGADDPWVARTVVSAAARQWIEEGVLQFGNGRAAIPVRDATQVDIKTKLDIERKRLEGQEQFVRRLEEASSWFDRFGIETLGDLL